MGLLVDSQINWPSDRSITSLMDEVNRVYFPVFKRFVLDPKVCRQLIDLAEKDVWHSSNFGSRKIHSLRSEEISKIESAVGTMIPNQVGEFFYHGLFPSTTQIFKYVKGDVFPLHTDKAVVFDDSAGTLFTIVIYLNPCQGGETYFKKYNLAIEPEQGSGLVFPQGLEHESREVISDVKYIVRAQALYSRD